VATACPISGKLIDAHAARVNGAITIVVLAVAAFTPAKWVLIPLAADFFVKAALGLRTSPLCRVSRAVVTALRLTPQLEDEAPKRFASGIGFVFSLGSVIAFYAGAPAIAMSLLGVFAFCAILEAAAGVCIGCKVYGIIVPLLSSREPALETARIDDAT